jgi:hypothetical protein
MSLITSLVQCCVAVTFVFIVNCCLLCMSNVNYNVFIATDFVFYMCFNADEKMATLCVS